MRKLLAVFFFMTTLVVNARMSLPDSLLTEGKAVELTLASPDTSLAIIQTMRQRNLTESWHLDCLEGEYYINQRQYRRVAPLFKKVLDSPALKDSTYLQMKLMMHLMYVYDKLSEDDDLTECVFSLEKMADKMHDNFFKAHTMFMLGKRLFYQGDSLGITTCKQAITMLRASNHNRKNNSLRDFYGEMLLIYQSAGMYDDAIRMTLLQEEIARIPTHIKMRYLDSRALRLTYALRASLYAEMGDFLNADLAYSQFLKMKGGNAIDDKYILGYLETKGLYEKALDVIRAYKHHLTHEGDSISHWMLTMMGHEAILCGMLDRPGESLEVARQIKSLTETLHKKESHDMMTTVYAFLNEKDEMSRHNLIMISFAFIGLLILLSVIGFLFYTIYRYRHQLKGKAVSKNDASMGEDSETDVDEIAENSDDIAEEQDSEGSQLINKLPTNDLGQLFAYMDKIVTRDKLFLKPNLKREELMRILGVDKNRFGKMMTHYSGSGNFSVYINMKRVEYGADLLKNHPEYTIATIAEMSGVASTVNFNRIFRQIYGVTPSEYRNNPDNTSVESGG